MSEQYLASNPVKNDDLELSDSSRLQDTGPCMGERQETFPGVREPFGQRFFSLEVPTRVEKYMAV